MLSKASVAVATLGLLAASVAGAAPAAADHVVDISPRGCDAGPFTFDLFGMITTRNDRHVSLEVHDDGSVVATCRFRNVPREAMNEDTGEPWVRPPAGTVDEVTACVLVDFPGRPSAAEGDWWGEGTARWGLAGRVTTVCTFDPSSLEDADA